MNTKECCLDVYMQFLPPGQASGKHRHLSEEVFYVVEGEGYDLHWDLKFECRDEMEFEWAAEPRRFDWREGDFVYIPPYCAHKHFNADPAKEARLIVINSRIIKAMGFDWFEQLERAEGY
jgi:gentisate 1,2-dioxygenase